MNEIKIDTNEPVESPVLEEFAGFLDFYAALESTPLVRTLVSSLVHVHFFGSESTEGAEDS